MDECMKGVLMYTHVDIRCVRDGDDGCVNGVGDRVNHRHAALQLSGKMCFFHI